MSPQRIQRKRTKGWPWAMPDQWHWWLGDRVTYAEPIPAVGRLGLWEWQR